MKYKILERVFLVKKHHQISSISGIFKAWWSRISKTATLSLRISFRIYKKPDFESNIRPLKQKTSRCQNSTKKPIYQISVSALSNTPTVNYHIIHEDWHLKPYKFNEMTKVGCSIIIMNYSRNQKMKLDHTHSLYEQKKYELKMKSVIK